MKTDYRKLDKKSEEKKRIQVVTLLNHQRNKSQVEVTDFLGVKQQVVSRWWCTYKKSGTSGLKMKSKKSSKNYEFL